MKKAVPSPMPGMPVEGDRVCCAYVCVANNRKIQGMRGAQGSP